MLCEDLPGGALLVAVADGMGGLEAGALASRTALAALRTAIAQGRPLAEAFREANEAVRAHSGEGRSGTTLVAALVKGDQVRVAHVGDSRAYHRGPLGLTQLTRDHTLVSDAEARGEWAQRQVAGTRWGAGVTRSLGTSADVEVDELGPFTLGPTGYVLLTSDGVHDVLDLDTMEDVLDDTRDAAAGAAHLVELALEHGGRDNASAVLVRRSADRSGVRTRREHAHPADLLVLGDAPRRRRGSRLSGILGIGFLVLVGLALSFYLS